MSISAEHRPFANLGASLIARDPIVASPDTAVLEAIALMHGAQMHQSQRDPSSVEADDAQVLHRVRASCVLVVDSGRYAGFLSERDIVRLIAQQQSLADIAVGQVIAPAAVSLRQRDWVDATAALDLIQQHGVSHLPILDEQDYPIGVATCESLQPALNRELRERRRVEALLLDSERRYASLSALAPVGIFRADLSGRCTYVNDHYCQLLQATPETILGQSWSHNMHPDDQLQVIEAWERHIQENHAFLVECRLYRSDGTTVWVYNRAMAEYDDSGKLIGYVGAITDISDRKQAEIALQKREAQSQALLALIPDHMVRIGADGVYRELVTSRRGHEIIPQLVDPVGQSIQALLPEPLAARKHYYMHQALQTGELQVYEQQVQIGDRLQDEEVRVIKSGEDEVLFMIRNITERKQAEAQLQRLITGTAAATGEDFFPALVQHVSETLQVSTVIVAERLGEDLHTLAWYADGALQPKFSYRTNNTACGQVLENGFFHREGLTQQDFTEDLAGLADMGVDSYLGVVLRSSSGDAVGTMCILDQEPIKKPRQAEKILRTFAVRAAAELERQQVTQSLEQLNQQLEAKVEERTAELQEREQFLQTVLDTLPIPVFWNDRNSVTLGCNQKFVDVQQVKSPADLIGKSTLEIVQNQDEARGFVADDKWVMETGRPKLHIEEVFTTSSGERKFLETNKAPLRDSTGNVVGIVITFQDITERKQAEQALQEREQFLQTVLDTVPIPVFWKDLNSVILGCNQHFIDVNQVESPTDVVGKSTPEFVQDPQEASGYDADDRWVMETGQPKLGIEEIFTTPSGEQRLLETNKAPLRDLSGNVIGIVATFQDITERKRAERDLQDSERRFRSAIANAPFPIMIYVEGGEVLQISAAWTEITGYTREEIPTIEIWTQVAYGDRAQTVRETIRETYSQTNRKDYGEFTIATRDGNQRIWQFSSAPLGPLPDGRRVVISMAVDVTERRQAELALRESEERYRTIYNRAAMGLVSAAADGRIIDANPHFCAMLGYSREELLAKTVEDITHPSDRNAIVLSSDQHSENEVAEHSQEKRYIRKDGTAFWASTGISFLHDAAGQFEHGLAIVRDISERKRAEAQVHALLRRSELLNRISSEIRASLELDTILHNLVNAVVAEFPIDSCTFGWYKRSEGPEKPAQLTVIREKKIEGLESCLRAYYSNQYPTLFENLAADQIFRADQIVASSDEALAEHLDRMGLATYLCLPIHTAGGKIGCLQLSRTDAEQPWTDEEIELFHSIADQVAIAIYQAQLYEESQAKTRELELSYQELQEAQIHMVQAEKMASLGQLVAGIAHEINNPVGFISGNLAVAENYVKTLTALVERYQQAYPQPPQAIAQLAAQADVSYLLTDFPKLLTSMENGATRIQAIVQSLRTFSRLEQVGQSAVNINQRIENTLVILQNRLNGRAGKPEVEVVKQYGDLPEIECYGSLLDQVFINLLVNAIDAIEERQAAANSGYSGRILITTAIADSSVLISIKDNGVGMDADTQASIFNPFFTTKPTGVETGMGLSISYQIVTGSHNGRLYCRSIPGEGTEFVVDIPRRLG
ncbi:MAG: PAS domain S-box protein [Elainellaceae cyanobacterium]